MKYIKFSNGPVRVLIAEENRNEIKEKLRLGFSVMKDKAGNPIYVDSKDIRGSFEDTEVKDLIYGLK